MNTTDDLYDELITTTDEEFVFDFDESYEPSSDPSDPSAFDNMLDDLIDDDTTSRPGNSVMLMSPN
jgi:hypothetical protein